jgi:hypothetical protein
MKLLVYWKVAAAAFGSLLMMMGHAGAETYTILASNARALSPGQQIEEGQAISLDLGEIVSFTVPNGGNAVQRRCSGPYQGSIRQCTNNSLPPRPGIPGGSRGSDD